MKSHVNDLLELAVCIYNDAAAKCTDLHPDVRDIKTIISRTEHEGLSFLTITLPDFCRDFEKSLADGQVDSTLFRSFRKRGKFPAFLQGYFSHVFNVGTGRIYDEPSIPAIEGIRQITNFFKKLEVPCSPERISKALTQFITDEHSFDENPISQDDTEVFLQVSNVLWGNVFSDLHFDANPINYIPKHGPGATAEKLSSNAKFLMRNWHDRLEPYFPLLDTAFVNSNAVSSNEFKSINVVSEEQEQPVRVIPVPKTLKGPRIIAIEPVCMQYTQQAISRELVKVLECHKLTCGHVNFTSQRVNRDLAMNASIDGRLSTIDLSSASDRVPYSIAIRMFDTVPDLQGAISACRSTRAQMPSGDVISLKKFASMGSALCFPIEAMYFYTICIVASLKKHNLPVSYQHIKRCASRIYVYGDDIIIPTNESDITINTLQKYHCKVNVHKSFTKGFFRESCGMDSYRGEQVTPVYMRQLIPDSERIASQIISCLSTSNQLYLKGYWKSSSFLLSRLEALIGRLPIIRETSAGLGKLSFQSYVSIGRWNRNLQRNEVRTLIARPVYKPDKIDGWPALLKCLLNMELRSTDELGSPRSQFPLEVDKEHLRRSARYGTVALQRRWVQPF